MMQEYILIYSGPFLLAALDDAPPQFELLGCLRPGVATPSDGKETEQATARGKGRTSSDVHWKN